MYDVVYHERPLAGHPEVARLRAMFPRATWIECSRYGEIFNRHGQEFRLQKRRPALIVAAKTDGFVQPVPEGYGVGGARNFYFSHMLNCVYDCRYCFLQGMFRSAHHVVFVNHADFLAEMERTLTGVAQPPSAALPGETWFFSGYDCDSLALDRVTGFVDMYLPFFAERPRAFLELRTRSVNVRPLLEREAIPNCVTAFSFTPDAISRALETGVPAVAARIEAAAQLQRAGWPVGLRFDPLLPDEDFERLYRELFESVFARLDASRIHSVSLGTFRLPREMFKRMFRRHPTEALFAGPMEDSGGMIGYAPRLQRRVMEFCAGELARHVPEEALFPCHANEGLEAAK